MYYRNNQGESIGEQNRKLQFSDRAAESEQDGIVEEQVGNARD